MHVAFEGITVQQTVVRAWRVNTEGMMSCRHCARIRAGWVPLTPQGRGGQRPLKEVSLRGRLSPLKSLPLGLEVFQTIQDEAVDSETGSDSSGSSNTSNSSVPADAGSIKGICAVSPSVFILNAVSGCVHAAVERADGSLGRACAPLVAALGNW